MIEVDDTTVALQALAHGIRREAGTKVVAITGSAGKTTTKEVTSEFLEVRYRVVRNRGNFNNHIGLPLSLIELRQRPNYRRRTGYEPRGEISTLVRVAEPDVRVWERRRNASGLLRLARCVARRRPKSSRSGPVDAARRECGRPADRRADRRVRGRGISGSIATPTSAHAVSGSRHEGPPPRVTADGRRGDDDPARSGRTGEHLAAAAVMKFGVRWRTWRRGRAGAASVAPGAKSCGEWRHGRR